MRTIKRTADGVPRIVAADVAGAYRGMGYCHGIDRGMQMLLTRVLGQGRLTEVLGGGPAAVASDVFFRRMNWAGPKPGSHPAAAAAGLDGPALANALAYCDGVNAALARRTPPEFQRIGFRPEPWSVGDCYLLVRMSGYLNLAQSQHEAERLLVELVQADVGRDRLGELFPGLLAGTDDDGGGSLEDLLRRVELGDRMVPSDLWGRGLPRLMASNNWVVAGGRTASGRPILANDPHLEVNRLPNVWYEVVLEAAGRWAAGATIPGIPGVAIGRSADLAWGMTYAFMDQVDSWVEHCKDGAYLREGRWVPFARREEEIRVRGGASVRAVLYENEHGILDGTPDGGERFRLATRFAGARAGPGTLRALSGLWDATTAADGMRCVGGAEMGLNWVLADARGGIGYQMSGLMPRRRPGLTGFAPAPGWVAANDWRGFVDPSDLPRVADPDDGLLVTANQDLNHLGAARPINLPMGPYRADRIGELLAGRDRLGAADMFAIQRDVHSRQAAAFMAVLRPLLPDTPAGRALMAWDCRYELDSRGATAFERVYRELLAGVFGRGPVGRAALGHLWDETSVFVDFYHPFDRILLSPRSAWFDGEDRDAVFRRAAVAALTPAPGAATTAPRPWGQGQRVLLTNIFPAPTPARRPGVDRGPLAIRGGRATVHQGQIYRSGGRTTSFVPGYRFVADLAEPAAHTALAGGPSERPGSRWYASGLRPWLRGDYKRLAPGAGAPGRSAERGDA